MISENNYFNLDNYQESVDFIEEGKKNLKIIDEIKDKD